MSAGILTTDHIDWRRHGVGTTYRGARVPEKAIRKCTVHAPEVEYGKIKVVGKSGTNIMQSFASGGMFSAGVHGYLHVLEK